MILSCQSQKPLKERLWERADHCHSMFEDVDNDGKLDMSDVIDDSQNGYLSVSGGWPPCGCECGTTVGAYKHGNGNYTLLQSEEYKCEWIRRISSDRKLKEVFPENFGINTFIPGFKQKSDKNTNAVFYLNITIPRIGTDTKVFLELIPFGMAIKSEDILCYEINERNEKTLNCKSIYGIKEIVSKAEDENTLNLLLKGSFDSISVHDRLIIQQTITTDKDDESHFKSQQELSQYLNSLKNIYEIYLSVENSQVTLGWNKEKGRFFVKEKSKPIKKVSFREFLLKNEYWSQVC
jgi:hypothetical protein